MSSETVQDLDQRICEQLETWRISKGIWHLDLREAHEFWLQLVKMIRIVAWKAKEVDYNMCITEFDFAVSLVVTIF